MSDQHRNSDHEEVARALSWKMFLIISAAAGVFSGAVYFFVL
jgi:hypothetical protein